MRTRRVLLSSASLFLAAAGTLWFVRRGTDHAPSTEAARARTRPKPAWVARLTRPRLTAGPQVAPEPLRIDRTVADNGGEAVQVVRLRAGQVLARVNGTAIEFKDLVPEGPDGERAMDPEMFRFLLDRAIDRELVLQAADAQDVSLPEEQEAQLAEMRASLAKDEPDVVRQLTRTLEQIDFELRDVAGLMVQAELLAKSGASSNVTPAMVQDYYEAHGSEFPPLPGDPGERQAAWQKIQVSIRQRLAPDVQAGYQEAVRRYLEQLRSSAEIAQADLGPG